MTTPLSQVFEKARASWKGNGSGSSPLKTMRLIDALPGLFDELGVRTIVDLGCGDLSWFYAVLEARPRLKSGYTGLDVVPIVIEHNRHIHNEEPMRFETIERTKDPLPECDLVFCRDVVAHLPHESVFDVLAQAKQAAKWLLVTTFPTTRSNTDIRAGQFRPLNLMRRPFDLPVPTQLLEDSDRKAMALYDTAVL